MKHRTSGCCMLLAFAAIGFTGCAGASHDHRMYVYQPHDPMPGEIFVAADGKDAKANPNWPAGFQLDIDVEIASVKSSKYRRPYVAVWIENPAQKKKVVRFLTVWGKEIKWQNSLRAFSPLAKFNGVVVDAVTRPTRPPGEYTVTWDGLDDKGNAVAAGDYIVHVEVSREHGTRVHMTETITCNDQKQEEKLEGNLEVSSVVIRFGPRKE